MSVSDDSADETNTRFHIMIVPADLTQILTYKLYFL